MATQTPHFSLQMPTIGGDSTLWGNYLNQDMTIIDSTMWANQQGSLPIGSIVMFAGASTGMAINWLICDGRSLDKTVADYTQLWNVIGYAFGGSGNNFNLPNLQTRFPIGAGSGFTLAATGGEATHTLTTPELPSHFHTITDPGHTHTIQNVVAPAAGGHFQGTSASGQNLASATTDPHTTNITKTDNTGSGTPHNNLPPYVAINFIIRAS